MKKRGIYSLLLCVMLIVMTLPVSAQKQSDTEVYKNLRIALTTNNKNKERITVLNKEILLGYLTEDSYEMEMWFSGYSKYFMEPANSTFLVSDTYYSDYNDAQTVSKQLQTLGYPAFPGVVGHSEWYVYMGRYDSKADANKAKKDVNSSFKDLDFSVRENNGKLYKLSGDSTVLAIVDYTDSNPQYMAVDNQGILDLGDRQYRGRLEVLNIENDTLTAINIISLEEYLYGVVPAEVYYKWEEEALKAQAVAARTYAVYTAFIAPKYPHLPYDLDDTVYCQVYKGYGFEKESTNKAVEDTNGQFVLYEGKPISAFFFSTSGGHTENSENAWSGTIDYLRGVPDIEETHPEKAPWIIVFTAQEVSKMLKDAGENIGDVLTMEVLKYSDSGRVDEMVIVGTNGSTLLSKSNIRKVLQYKLYSNKFTLLTSNSPTPEVYIGADSSKAVSVDSNLQVVTANGQAKLNFTDGQVVVASKYNLYNYTDMHPAPGTFVFAGMGYGHGVGMSQSGAQSMALSDYTYMQILTHYYQGASVEKLY